MRSVRISAESLDALVRDGAPIESKRKPGRRRLRVVE
jgi:hypothetical protein